MAHNLEGLLNAIDEAFLETGLRKVKSTVIETAQNEKDPPTRWQNGLKQERSRGLRWMMAVCHHWNGASTLKTPLVLRTWCEYFVMRKGFGNLLENEVNQQLCALTGNWLG